MVSRKGFLVASALLPFLAKFAKAEEQHLAKEDGFSPGELNTQVAKIEKEFDEYHFYDIRELKDKFCLAHYKEVDYFIQKEFRGQKVHLYIPCDICNGEKHYHASLRFRYYASKIQCPICLKYSKNRDGSLT